MHHVAPHSWARWEPGQRHAILQALADTAVHVPLSVESHSADWSRSGACRFGADSDACTRLMIEGEVWFQGVREVSALCLSREGVVV